MRNKKIVEVGVGFFMIVGLIAFALLALQVSGLTHITPQKTYELTAQFGDIGSLKRRAAVAVAGVQIGQVKAITLNKEYYTAIVTMEIDANINNLPIDSAASIKTRGILGDNYISIALGFDDAFLRDGDEIEETYQALILEDLIGQFVAGQISKTGGE